MLSNGFPLKWFQKWNGLGLSELGSVLYCMGSGFLGFFLLIGCSLPPAPEKPTYFLTADNKTKGSTTAGNLIATAIKDVYELDIVFYPVDLLDERKSAVLKDGLSKNEVEDILDLYPAGANDVFLLGSMKGESIKKFLVKRSQYKYQKDLDVAGMRYDIGFWGGFPSRQSFVNEGLQPLVDDQYYRVAVSDVFFFSGMAFPGYKYGDAMNFTLNQENRKISARETLKTFLTSDRYAWPFLTERRAEVSKGQVLGNGQHVKTWQIQGDRHVSPLIRHRVTTSGVITAFGVVDWYPGGVDIYIQDPEGDGRDETSDGLHIYLADEAVDLQVGDHITVTGVVYEQVSNNELGRTSLRDVSQLRLNSRGVMDLPAPVRLGEGGRAIPKHHISTYNGNLNEKTWLNLKDGIDFWESLEGMRVEVKDLRVVGFRGGNEDHESHVGREKGYLNIYFVADALEYFNNMTPAGGIYADVKNGDFNPEIMQIATNHLTNGFDTGWILNVGDKIPGSVRGVLGYERNIFGDGEYSLVVPNAENEPAFRDFKGSGRRVKPLDERHNKNPGQGKEGMLGKIPTKLETSPHHLTVATFNLENLAGFEDERIGIFAESIAENLRCPDIVNLVEIQDANGSDFDGDADGTVTLKKMISSVPRLSDSPCMDVDYHYANIDPILHGEGGKPGGNIRISVLYNANKVSFTPNTAPSSRTEAWINHEGSLQYNPGRVYPNDDAFKGSRKSIVVEFEVFGKKLFIIGNHLNSKLGDASHWSAVQPPYFKSELRRIKMADKVNQFVQRIEQGSPGAMVLVVGDFNAFVEEASMMTLKGEELWNLTEKLPVNDRYTTNHNGNSQSLDYILVNKSLLDRFDRVEVIHLNSDFMGRLSDHDPVLSRFHIAQ